MSLKTVGNKVIVKEIQVENRTAGGIIIEGSLDKDAPLKGEVVAVGPGKLIGSTFVPTEVQVGDIVLFGKRDSVPLKHDQKEYIVVNENSILCVLED